MGLLVVFLLLTLGLSLWLGFQAVVAARSHRRTAEGILRDYADVAASEFARRTGDHLELLFRELFEEVPWRIRRDPPPGPEVVAGELRDALRRLDCRCEALREQAAFLVLDLTSGRVESIPPDLPEGVTERAAEAVRARWAADPEERIAFFTAPAGGVLEGPTALAFNVSLESSGEVGQGRAVYVMMAPLATVEELFSGWYREEALLPEVITRGQPNDSLLHLALLTPEEVPIFLSPRDDPQAFLTRDTLVPEYGGLVVEAAVRPDAASALVIGGLPRSRLPLLLALMILTMGVGAAALLQIRKEEELARLREDFISGVSHEFRTPLTQIRMFTELMADGKLRTEEEWKRSTAVINREARRLTHLVENILYFSRMGRAPASQGPRETVAVQDTLRDLTEAFTPLALARETTLEVEVRPGDAVALAPRSGVYQMMANLLDNALKYGPRGQRVRVVGEAQGGWVRLAVEDQGPGIPPGERDRIWDPYHRLQRDVEGVERGSGIGLSVVKRLAEGAGGRVWVEAQEGGGTRFVVELPAAEGEA